VDDEPSFRRFLCVALGDQGYRVFASANGADALRFLKLHPVDLVLSDINMPAMNGFELKQEFDLWSTTRTPFVMMTADGRRDNAEDAASLGVVFVLAKPIRNLDSLYALVSEALVKK
jgi:CheY-like chemotaxis protein